MLGDMNETQLPPNDVAACQTILVEQNRKIHELQYANVE